MRHLKRFAPVFVGLGLLAYLIRLIGWEDVVGAFNELTAVALVCAALCLGFGYLLGALNQFLLLRVDAPQLSFLDMIRFYWLSAAVGLVIPGQVGDAATIAVLLRRRGVSYDTSARILLIDKCSSLLVSLVFAGVGLYLVGIHNMASLPEGYILSVSGGIVFLLIIAGVCLMFLMRVVDVSLMRVRIAAFGRSVVQFLMKRPTDVLRNAAITLCKVSIVGCSYVILFAEVQTTNVSPLLIVALVCAASLLAYIPVAFNGIGVVEFAATGLFAIVGISASAVVTVYVVLRALSIAVAYLPILGMWHRVFQVEDSSS